MQNYRVTAHALSVRKSPSLSDRIIGYLSKDDVVPLLDKSEDEHWCRIETSSGVRGWLFKKFLVSADRDKVSDAGHHSCLNIAICEAPCQNQFF